jgi:hypothetical protein
MVAPASNDFQMICHVSKVVAAKSEQDWGKNMITIQFFMSDFFNMGSPIALR